MFRNTKLLFFLWGLGSQLQIIASLSFTELFVLAAAPILVWTEWPYLRRNGVLPLWWLSMMVVVGGAIACLANGTEFRFALRGMAVVCLLPCAIVVGHWMLRRDMNGFKWMMLGGAISGILCTFWFQKSVEVATYAGGEGGVGSAEAIMSGPLYWIQRLGGFVTLPARGWYLSCPQLYCLGAPLFMAAFGMLIIQSGSGRSAALGAIASAVIVFIGGKRRASMAKICKHFWLFCFVGIVGVLLAKSVYSYSAEAGWLGEKARQKYEAQTQGDKSMMKLILGGRGDSFAGLLACKDKPLVGWGPWAQDRDGYMAEFLRKYGTAEDYDRILEIERGELEKGEWGTNLIPCHSHITSFWVTYGIWGLVFWLYIIFVLLRYLRQDCWAVPQWFMWLAASIPGFLWHVFFSPFASRAGSMVFVVAILMTRAVRRGRQPLPPEMLREISRVER